MAGLVDRIASPAVARRDLLAFFGGGITALIAGTSAGAGDSLTELPLHFRRRVLQAYIYGYAPVTAWATKRIQTAVPSAGLIAGAAPVNQFAYTDQLADPSETTVIRPNADTIYTTAWLDLRRQPMVMSLPAVRDRYYLIPLLDAYSNQFASLGSRTTGGIPGDYLIAGPRWSGRAPRGIAALIRAPTPIVWVLGRTLVRGPDDLADVVAITSRFVLVPLDRYGTGYIPPTDVLFRNPEPEFVPPKGEPVTAAPGFQSPEFFRSMRRFIAANPPPLEQARLVESFLPVFAHPEQLTPAIADFAQAAMAAAIRAAGTAVNGWSFSLDLGAYGENYALRAAIAGTGFGANIKEDAVYANCSTDSTGAPLDGSTGDYTMRFAPGQQPPVSGFWSITAYNQLILLVANPIDRYTVGSETGLVPDLDGSVTVQLRSRKPPDSVPQPNWLPVPEGPFSLTLRMYWAKKQVLNGAYEIPAVVKSA